MPLKLKPEFALVKIGFNNSSKPLGERDDLFRLYDLARIKNHKAHLDMFEEVPTESELDAMKEKEFYRKQELKFKRRILIR